MENQRHQLELLPNFWKRTKSIEHPHKSRNTWITWGNLWMPMSEQCLVQGCELLQAWSLKSLKGWLFTETDTLWKLPSSLKVLFFSPVSSTSLPKMATRVKSTWLIQRSSIITLVQPFCTLRRNVFCSVNIGHHLHLSNPLIIVLPGVKPGENMNLQYLTSNLAITHPWRECSIIVSRNQILQNLKIIFVFQKNFSV